MYEDKINLDTSTVEQIIEEFYDLGEILDISPLDSGHESDNVKVSSKKGDYVLRLHFYPQYDYIEVRMKIHELLHEYGVKVPTPIKTRDDNYIAKLDDNNLLVLMTFISGDPIFREDKEKMFKWMSWFGKQFGIFHFNSKKISLDLYKQKIGIGDIAKHQLPPGSWVMDRYNERDTLLPKHEKNSEIISGFEEFLETIEKSDFSELTMGVVHEDMMPANFFKKGNELMGILDFGCNYSYLITDIGTWIFYTKLYKPELKQNYLDFILPYLEYSKIPVEELKNLTLFLISRAYLQFFYFAFRVINNITQGYDDEEDPIEENRKSFEKAIPFVQLVTSIDSDYFYDIAIQALEE